MTSARASVFIALPVLNEAPNIEPLLDEIDEHPADYSYVVCIVDDGSRDGTRDIVARRVAEAPERGHVIHPTKTSRGSQRGGALHAALAWGVANTAADVFVEMDGDRSHRPIELPGAIEAITTTPADVVIASKFVPGSVAHP